MSYTGHPPETPVERNERIERWVHRELLPPTRSNGDPTVGTIVLFVLVAMSLGFAGLAGLPGLAALFVLALRSFPARRVVSSPQSPERKQ